MRRASLRHPLCVCWRPPAFSRPSGIFSSPSLLGYRGRGIDRVNACTKAYAENGSGEKRWSAGGRTRLGPSERITAAVGLSEDSLGVVTLGVARVLIFALRLSSFRSCAAHEPAHRPRAVPSDA